jgi:hypothetical protein
MDREPLSWPKRVVGLFLDRFGLGAEPQASRRLDHLPYGIHLSTGAGSVELFPPGPLDVLRLYQRQHASLAHEIEYVSCVPRGDSSAEYLAYAVFRLEEEEELPLICLNDLERELKRSYGSFVHLPRSRSLLEHQYSDDLNDGDPPHGLNRVLAPKKEKSSRGRMTVTEILRVLREELDGHQIVSWLEASFLQRPANGTVEHRYYLDSSGRVYLVRDHFSQGKTLYRSQTNPEALQPVRRR